MLYVVQMVLGFVEMSAEPLNILNHEGLGLAGNDAAGADHRATQKDV